MAIRTLAQPPRKEDLRFEDWMFQLWTRVTQDEAFQDIKAVIVAASAAVNTTETIIVGGLSNAKVAANTLKVGTTIRATLYGTCTASAANVSTFAVRFGTAGTTSDGLLGTAATAVSATTGTAIPFVAQVTFTVRTVGATGTIAGFVTVTNQGTTGIATGLSQTIALTPTAIDTTANNWISFTYKSAATTTTSTFQLAFIEVVKQ